MKERYKEAARIFKAFGDPNRVQILELLKDGERCACKLLANTELTQSGLSYHMNILCGAGIVESRPVGKWTHYRLNDAGRRKIISLLEFLTTPHEPSGEELCGKIEQ